jgi:hypothetical protein
MNFGDVGANANFVETVRIVENVYLVFWSIWSISSGTVKIVWNVESALSI